MTDKPYDIETGAFGMRIRYKEGGLFQILADDFSNGKSYDFTTVIIEEERKRFGDLFVDLALAILDDNTFPPEVTP